MEIDLSQRELEIIISGLCHVRDDMVGENSSEDNIREVEAVMDIFLKHDERENS